MRLRQCYRWVELGSVRNQINLGATAERVRIVGRWHSPGEQQHLSSVEDI